MFIINNKLIIKFNNNLLIIIKLIMFINNTLSLYGYSPLT